MRRRAVFAVMMRRALVALLLLSLGLAMIPGAAADHTYSHRYVVFGRVVDETGAPVANVEVVGDPSFSVEGPCPERPEAATDAWGADAFSRTNERGEFWLCFHAHVIPREGAHVVRLNVTKPEDGTVVAAREVEADPRLRVSFADLQIPGAWGANAATAWTDAHLVVGRAWSPWVPGEPLDHVPVDGIALRDREVDIEITSGGATTTARAVTNGYGDFAVRVPLDAPLADDATVTVRVADTTATAPAGPHGWTHLKVETPPFAEFVLVTGREGSEFFWQSGATGERNPTLRVLPGTNVSLIVVNGDGGYHNIQVAGHEASPYLDQRDSALMYNFTAPEEGTLDYWCIPHRSSGMIGSIVVATSAADAEQPDQDAEPPAATTTPPTGDATPATPTGAASPAPTAQASPTPGAEAGGDDDTPLPPLLAVGGALVAAALARRASSRRP